MRCAKVTLFAKRQRAKKNVWFYFYVDDQWTVFIRHVKVGNKPTEENLHTEFFICLFQRFSNFFQVGTTFISQNVLRTTLLLELSNSLGLP